MGLDSSLTLSREGAGDNGSEAETDDGSSWDDRRNGRCACWMNVSLSDFVTRPDSFTASLSLSLNTTQL